MRNWMQGNVEFAQHYMERFYEKKDFRTRDKPVIDEMQEEVNKRRIERGMSLNNITINILLSLSLDEAKKRKGKKVEKVIRTRFIRDHLPPETENQFLIAVRDFLPALSAYYSSCGCPLLLSEQQSLINRFKEHGTGRMKVMITLITNTTTTTNNNINTTNRLIKLRHIFNCMKYPVVYMVE